MKTGTDISIRVCREEGYAVVDHTTKNLNPDKEYRISISNPELWPNGYRSSQWFNHMDAYLVDSDYCYRELYEDIKEDKGFKSFVDWENCPFTAPDDGPSFSELASLAQSISAYKGLE